LALDALCYALSGSPRFDFGFWEKKGRLVLAIAIATPLAFGNAAAFISFFFCCGRSA